MEMQVQTEIQGIRQELNYLKTLISAVGLPTSPWLTPDQAARILGISGQHIRDRLKKAEERRILRQASDLVYGIHYRDDRDPESKQASWKINLLEWEKNLRIPPEHRC